MNFENTNHALICPEYDVTNKKSSIIYKQFIFAPGTILMNIIERLKLQERITKELVKNIILYTNDKKWKDLQNETFTVIHENNNDLVRRKARLKYVFNSQNVYKSIKDILEGFRSYKVPHDQVELHQLLISSFVILEFCCDNATENTVQTLLASMTEDIKSSERINKLDTVTCVTTPFAHESFFKTVNSSKVANIFGINNCLLIISAPLVYGCEGGGVYDKNKNLIGIVLNTTFCWNNETAILSLVANYRDVAREFLQQINSNVLKVPAVEPATTCQMQNSVVLIQSGASWGTGCLLKINKTKLIITCSHIITTKVSSTVTCFWNRTEFASKVVYKNPKYNHAYDIAILSVPANIPNEHFAEHDIDKPKVGDIVYSIGFPYFSTFSKKIDSPSIYEGRITKTLKGMLLSDVNVQSGQSGCPLFSKSGKLVGVCISNSKDSVYNLVYPNISMAVPIYDIITTLNSYSLFGNESVLNQLEASDDILDVWQLKPPQVISKL